MPVFEIQSPSGRIFTIEAPDQDTAIQGASTEDARMSSASPYKADVADIGADRARAREGIQSQEAARLEEMPSAGVSALSGLQGISNALPFFNDVSTAGDYVGNKIVGGVNSLLPENWQGQKIKENYGKGYQQLKDERIGRNRAVQQAAPVSNLVGNVAGAVALPPVFKAGQGAGLAARVRAGAADAAIMSGLQGLGEGESIEARLKNAGSQALIAAPLGAGGRLAVEGIGGAVGGIKKARDTRAMDKWLEKAPSVDEVKAAGSRAYEAADQIGLQVKQAPFDTFVKQLETALQKEGIDKTLTPKSTAALGRVQEIVGQQPTLQDLDTLRKIAGAAAGSIETADKRIGVIIQKNIDDFVEKLNPNDVISGDAKKAMQALTDARGNWAAKSRAETLNKAEYRADLNANSAGSGGNIDNTTRQALKSIALDPKRTRGWNDVEKAALDSTIRGTPLQNALRLVGKAAPTGIVSGGIGIQSGAGAGAVLGGPVGAMIGSAFVPTVGYLSKKAADKMTDKSVERLAKMLLSRSPEGQARMGSAPKARYDENKLKKSIEAIARLTRGSAIGAANQTR